MSGEGSAMKNFYRSGCCNRRSRKPIVSDDSSDESDDGYVNKSQHAQQYGSNDISVNGSIITLSSASKVSAVVSSFDEMKRKLVESIGFGSMLHLPEFTHTSTNFYYWLLQRMKWYPKTFNLAGRFKLKVTSEHISTIIGLSSSGLEVNSKPFADDVEKTAFIKSSLSFLCTESQIVQAAEDYILSDFQGYMSTQQCNNFKIAFVIFVMGRFLAPSKEASLGHTDFWGALENPDHISRFNWSSYILLHIMEAARVVHWSTVNKTKVRLLSGCSIIVQILYLDNIDFKVLNLNHDIFPRVKHFSSDVIKRMIEADIVEDPTLLSGFTFGRQQVIRSENNCYISSKEALTTTSDSTPSLPFTCMSSDTPHKAENTTPFHSVSNKPMNTFTPGTYCKPSMPFTYISSVTAPKQPNISISPSPSNKFIKPLNPPSDSSPLMPFTSMNNDTGHKEDNANTVPAAMAKLMSNHCGNTSSASSMSPTTNALQIPPCLSTSPQYYDTAVLDFSKFIRDNYKGQIDDALLDNLQRHNARCLSHIHKFSLGLKSAITKENAQLSLKFIEHQKKISGTPASSFSTGNLQTRRRKYDDIQSEPEVGTEAVGECSASKPSIKSNASIPDLASKQKHLRNDPKSNHLSHADDSSLSKHVPSNVVAQNLANLPPTSSHSGFAEKTALSPHLCSKQIIRPTSLFKTPTPTSKLAPITPTVSPIAENSQYSGIDLSLNFLSTVPDIDLNTCSIHAISSAYPALENNVELGMFATSHWEMGKSHQEIDASFTSFLFKWLSTTSSDDLKRSWILHDSPRVLRVIGEKLKEEVSSSHPTSTDVFDIAIRRIKQLDQSIVPKDIHLQWRHLFESDFAMHVLSSDHPGHNLTVQEQFIGESINYELCRCRMFFVPVFSKATWWCYAWDCKSNKVYIMDPLVGAENDEAVLEKHVGTIDKLSKYLSKAVTELFVGWTPKFNSCTPVVFRTPGIPCDRSQTGFFTLFCIWHFNGTTLVSNPSELNLQKFKEYMLYQMLDLSGNTGQLPSAFCHILD